MTCTIVAAVVTCVMAPGEKKISAKEAADILRPNQYVHVPRFERDLPVVSTLATGPTLGPWEFPKFEYPRRLDGTRREHHPVDYGGYPLIQVVVTDPGLRNLPVPVRTSDRMWARHKMQVPGESPRQKRDKSPRATARAGSTKFTR